jgi:hypothetical protein
MAAVVGFIIMLLLLLVVLQHGRLSGTDVRWHARVGGESHGRVILRAPGRRGRQGVVRLRRRRGNEIVVYSG